MVNHTSNQMTKHHLKATRFSQIKHDSQRSQYMFFFCLWSIQYDFRILFFLMDASHAWKKKNKDRFPHSFVLKKTKLGKGKTPNTLALSPPRSLREILVQNPCLIFQQLPFYHTGQTMTRKLLLAGAATSRSPDPGLPFLSPRGQETEGWSPGSFSTPKLAQWTTARWVTSVESPWEQGLSL